jgi:erythromycin esterase-like protein
MGRNRGRAGWFLDGGTGADMATMLGSSRSTDADANQAAAAIRPFCEPLPPIDDANIFGTAFDRLADARVVLLGEATHGTSEFYRARAAITRRLVERHGFTVVAVEADWPDANRIDRYVRHRPLLQTEDEAFTRFPTWMWRNSEVYDFLDWLRGYNESVARNRRVEFRGLDLYSLGSSIAAVLAYLDEVDPEEAKDARALRLLVAVACGPGPLRPCGAAR